MYNMLKKIFPVNDEYLQCFKQRNTSIKINEYIVDIKVYHICFAKFASLKVYSVLKNIGLVDR